LSDFAESLTCLVTASHPTRRVGCVIIDQDVTEVVAFGFNGVAQGQSITDDESGDQHAEVNAMVKVSSRFPMELRSMIMIVTTPPCKKCAGYILNAAYIGLLVTHHDLEAHQIVREYDDLEDKGQCLFDPTDGVELLMNAGIPVIDWELLAVASRDPSIDSEETIAQIREDLAKWR